MGSVIDQSELDKPLEATAVAARRATSCLPGEAARIPPERSSDLQERIEASRRPQPRASATSARTPGGSFKRPRQLLALGLNLSPRLPEDIHKLLTGITRVLGGEGLDLVLQKARTAASSRPASLVVFSPVFEIHVAASPASAGKLPTEQDCRARSDCFT